MAKKVIKRNPNRLMPEPKGYRKKLHAAVKEAQQLLKKKKAAKSSPIEIPPGGFRGTAEMKASEWGRKFELAKLGAKPTTYDHLRKFATEILLLVLKATIEEDTTIKVNGGLALAKKYAVLIDSRKGAVDRVIYTLEAPMGIKNVKGKFVKTAKTKKQNGVK